MIAPIEGRSGRSTLLSPAVHLRPQYAASVGAIVSDMSNEVLVSRPSDALVAQRAACSAFTGLLLGLGVVALLGLSSTDALAAR
jgi:hypothetical protein